MKSIKQKRRERRQVLWPVLLTAVIIWESVSSIPSVGPPLLSFDKLAHFGVFGLLATAIARLEKAKNWPLPGAWWAVVMVSAYGGATELLQSLTPMRSMEFDDWVADTLGAALAVFLYLHWTWYRRLLERPLCRRRPPADQGQARVEISPESRPNQVG
jgi:VanZ family protein